MAKKEIKKLISPEEQRENNLKLFIRDETKFMPEPTYKYCVGDKVSIGRLQDVKICNIIGNGIYEIDYSTTDTNYGDPIKHEHQKRFVKWYDIRPYDQDIKGSLIKNSDLRLSYSQRHMGDIFSKVYHFGVNFDPEYQREYVWNLDDKVALVDSVFNCIDIGKFVFIHKDYGDKYLYEILDGKQRIRAILDYFENRFSYNGKYFNDLSPRDKDHFEEYPISVAEVRDITKKQAMQYFVMVNKHGRIMSKDQIEKVEKMIEMED